jgi:peptidoglycan hydrolase-like protein with peptidoglycan-binding domain
VDGRFGGKGAALTGAALIQTLLARLGYDPDPANGVVGLKTNMAIDPARRARRSEQHADRVLQVTARWQPGNDVEPTVT